MTGSRGRGAAGRSGGDEPVGVDGAPEDVSGTGRRAPDGAPPQPARGVDLARAALDAARASNAAQRSAGAGRRAATVRSGQPGASTRLGRRRWSGPGPDKRRDPQPLNVTMKGWVGSTGAAAEITRATLFTRWGEIVGAGIADHCTPTSLVDGELVVQAESTAWATQLRLLAGTIQQKINAEVGRGAVTRIRAKGPSGPSWRFGNRHVSGRGPRDTYG